MKRLVYTPKVEAFVKTDYGLFDLSSYVTGGNMARKLDQISTATVTIRNPNKKWTDYEFTDEITGEALLGPIFHPMDPITIVMTRIQNHPVQTFTGFLDTTPYLQMFPGTVTLQASCTLKKLLYTYFDAGLPFFNEFLSQSGWEVLPGVGIASPQREGKLAKETGELSESGFGELLYRTLNEIGGWEPSTLFIEKIPGGLIELVSNLFTSASKEAKESNKEFISVLHNIIGTAALGEGIPGSGEESGKGGYSNPFANTKHLIKQRIDQGVDYEGEGPIDAMGEAKILMTSPPPNWPEGGGVVYELIAGSRKGQCIYVFEGVNTDPNLHVGQIVQAGQQIATFRPGGSIETGFCNSSGQQNAINEFNGSNETKWGKQMAAFLRSVGAPVI